MFSLMPRCLGSRGPSLWADSVEEPGHQLRSWHTIPSVLKICGHSSQVIPCSRTFWFLLGGVDIFRQELRLADLLPHSHQSPWTAAKYLFIRKDNIAPLLDAPAPKLLCEPHPRSLVLGGQEGSLDCPAVDEPVVFQQLGNDVSGRFRWDLVTQKWVQITKITHIP